MKDDEYGYRFRSKGAGINGSHRADEPEEAPRRMELRNGSSIVFYSCAGVCDGCDTCDPYGLAEDANER